MRTQIEQTIKKLYQVAIQNDNYLINKEVLIQTVKGLNDAYQIINQNNLQNNLKQIIVQDGTVYGAFDCDSDKFDIKIQFEIDRKDIKHDYDFLQVNNFVKEIALDDKHAIVIDINVCTHSY